MAKWIWIGDDETVNQYADFRASFALAPGFERAILRISADGKYACRVNGQYVEASQYSDYPDEKTFDEVDVSVLCRAGDNALDILAYCANYDDFTYRRGRPGLWYELVADGVTVSESGDGTACRRAAGYFSGPLERLSPQVGYTFRYDAADEGGPWERATAQAARALKPRPIKPLIVEAPAPGRLCAWGKFLDAKPFAAPGERMWSSYLSPRALPAPTARFPSEEGVALGECGYAIVDLGRETAGYLALDVDLPSGGEVLIGYGEHLSDLRARTFVGGRQFACLYRGVKGRNSFRHYFTRAAGRYVQVQAVASEAILRYAGILPTRYPVKRKPLPDTGDRLRARIAEVCRDTLELCMHEHYEDCPWREQALYGMDSRNQMLFGYIAFENDGFAKASLRLLAAGQREDGLLELCAPARTHVNIPCFTLSFIVALAENLRHTGDIAFARETLPTVERALEAFKRRERADGLVPRFEGMWNFYEWADGLDDGVGLSGRPGPSGCDLPLNGYLTLALEAAAYLAQALGDSARAKNLRDWAGKLRAAMAAFKDEESGLFYSYIEADGSRRHLCELSQALAALSGAAGDDARPLQALAHPDGSLVKCTLGSMPVKYEALLTKPERYGEIVLAEIDVLWGGMLFSGATSFWETALGEADFSNAGSLCHGWSAAPLYVYSRLFTDSKGDKQTK